MTKKRITKDRQTHVRGGIKAGQLPSIEFKAAKAKVEITILADDNNIYRMPPTRFRKS